MSKIDKILVPTDFSESANLATNYVAELTKDLANKEVTFIHVSENNDAAVNEKLHKVKEEFTALSEAKCNVEYQVGTLSTELLKFQEENKQDLIIMGTEGSEGEELSNSAEVALQADFPVLIIPKSNKRSGDVKNIVLAIDKDAIDDSSSLTVLHSLAREKNAKVHVLTVETGDNNKLVSSQINESVLEYYLETLDWKQAFPKNKDIEAGIANYIEENDIDMLAILPRNHPSEGIPSEGKLTKVLTLHSKVPVLVID